MTNPTSNHLVLKIFNSSEELVWYFQISLDKDNTFQTALPLSDPIWTESTFYVLTAKSGETINETSFEINGSGLQETTTSVILRTFDKFLPQNILLPISTAEIFVIGTMAYFLYSRRTQKKVASVKHESLPLIMFDAPSPVKVYLSNGTDMSYDEWSKIPQDQRPKINSVEFWIAIKNIGSDAVKNITFLFIERDKMFSRQDMKLEEGKSLDKQILLPELLQAIFIGILKFRGIDLLDWKRIIFLSDCWHTMTNRKLGVILV